MPGKTGENLLTLLERRLDNLVFRLGLAPTIPAARQLVSHGRVRVNGRLAPRGGDRRGRLSSKEVRAEVYSFSRGRALRRGLERKMCNFSLCPRRRQRSRTPGYRVHVLYGHCRREPWNGSPFN